MKEMTDEDRALLEDLRSRLTPTQETMLGFIEANLDLLVWSADPQSNPATLKADYRSDREVSSLSWGCLLTAALPVALLTVATNEFQVIPTLMAGVACLGPILLRRRAAIDDHYLIDFEQRRIDRVQKTGPQEQRKPFYRFDELHSLALCREVHVEKRRGKPRQIVDWVLVLITRQGQTLRWLDFSKNRGGATGVGEKLAAKLAIGWLDSEPELALQVRRSPGGLEIKRVPPPSPLRPLFRFVLGVLLLWGGIQVLAALQTRSEQGRVAAGPETVPPALETGHPHDAHGNLLAVAQSLTASARTRARAERHPTTRP